LVSSARTPPPAPASSANNLFLAAMPWPHALRVLPPQVSTQGMYNGMPQATAPQVQLGSDCQAGGSVAALHV
jgi:hypothetical protein